MKPEYKTPWVAALRSGEFKQGKEYLVKKERYCCLGVLCEVASLWVNSARACLGSANLYEVGLTSGEEQTLIEMNDDQGKSFTEIADWIEENL